MIGLYNLSIGIMLVYLLVGCGSQVGPAGDDPDSATLEPEAVYRDPAVPVEVRVSNVFALALESNPTTGYQWQLAQPLDEAIVKLVGSQYQPPARVLPGAGGIDVWRFQAIGQGQTSIALKYVRPWEKDTPPIAQQTFTIVVRE